MQRNAVGVGVLWPVYWLTLKNLLVLFDILALIELEISIRYFEKKVIYNKIIGNERAISEKVWIWKTNI